MTRAGDAIARLRELEGKATPGPWTVQGGDLYSEKAHDIDGMVAEFCIGSTPNTYSANADFIAAMRNALPALLDVADAALRWRDQPDGGYGLPTGEEALLAALEKLEEVVGHE